MWDGLESSEWYYAIVKPNAWESGVSEGDKTNRQKEKNIEKIMAVIFQNWKKKNYKDMDLRSLMNFKYKEFEVNHTKAPYNQIA